MLTVQLGISTVRISVVDQSGLLSMILWVSLAGPMFVSCYSHSGPVRITIVVMNVAMIGEMTVTGTTVTKKKDTDVIAQGPPVGLNMMNVVHLGLRFKGESLTIKGLQGTMITGAEAMMTAERLIIILTAAGTIRTDAETTEDATTKTSALMRGRGTQMEKDGRVEWYLFSMAAWGRNGRLAYWFISLIRSLWCCRLHGPCTSDGQSLVNIPRRRVRSIYIFHISRPIWGLRNCLEHKGYFFPWLVSSFWLDVSHTLKNDEWHSLRGRKRIYDPSELQLNGHSSWFVHHLSTNAMPMLNHVLCMCTFWYIICDPGSIPNLSRSRESFSWPRVIKDPSDICSQQLISVLRASYFSVLQIFNRRLRKDMVGRTRREATTTVPWTWQSFSSTSSIFRYGSSEDIYTYQAVA